MCILVDCAQNNQSLRMIVHCALCINGLLYTTELCASTEPCGSTAHCASQRQRILEQIQLNTLLRGQGAQWGVVRSEAWMETNMQRISLKGIKGKLLNDTKQAVLLSKVKISLGLFACWKPAHKSPGDTQN